MDAEKRRKDLFTYLDKILRLSEEKFETDRKRQDLRLKWGRLMVQAIVAYGKLLETVQLDDLMKEIEQIKQHVGMET